MSCDNNTKNYDSLELGQQAILDERVKKVSKEELEIAYKEAYARKWFNNRPLSIGAIIGIFLIAAIVLFIVTYPAMTIENARIGIKSVGNAYCEGIGEHFVSSKIGFWGTIAIECSKTIIIA